uniref:Uncharacterized protein n=1 Tax=Strongyloides stercoralis TaxID=6248 RepID=A0A0K0DUW7_STRER
MPSFWRKSWKDSIISSRPTTPKESNSICDNEFSLNHDDIELIDGSPTRIFTENRRSFDFFNNTKDDIIFSSFNRFFKKRSSYQNIETFKGIQLPSTDLIRRRKTKMNGNTGNFFIYNYLKLNYKYKYMANYLKKNVFFQSFYY